MLKFFDIDIRPFMQSLVNLSFTEGAAKFFEFRAIGRSIFECERKFILLNL